MDISRARSLVDAVDDEADAALRNLQRTPGGQQVPFHGDFVGCNVRGLKRIKWWMRELRTSLADGSEGKS